MKYLLSVVLLFLLSGRASAAGFNAVYSQDGSDVWAVGNAGSVSRSLDGGLTWSSLALTSDALHDVTARKLTIWVVGDAGKVRRSLDFGNTWNVATLPGSPQLNGIDMATDSTGYVVGNGGVIFKTTNAGTSWTPQTSGTTQHLHGVRFSDAAHGWAVGASGVILTTSNGGTTWTPAASNVTKDLLAIDLSGSTLWAVGKDGAASRSLNGGASWTPVDLKIDSGADAVAVAIQGGTVTIAGGGGFIRCATSPAGAWTFRRHTFQGPVTGMHLNGSKGWVVNSKNRAVLRTDDGVNWALSPGVTASKTWTQVYPYVGSSVRGSTICQHPTNENTFYGAITANLLKSQNRGDSWMVIGSIPAVTKTNAFYVSPLDTLLMVAAVNNPDRIVRSVNGGASWTTVISRDFSEYGMPIELNPDDPNEILFAPEDGRLYRSQDFGASWDTLSNPGFSSPCDIYTLPDTTNVIWVADGVANPGKGKFYRSVNGGLTFQTIYTALGSEIPMIGGSRLNNAFGISTNWPSGGVKRTLNYGASWDSVAGTAAAWGATVSQDDPTFAIYGVTAGAQSYLSFDQGSTFTAIPLTNFNYSLAAFDRNTVLAEQGNGFFKLYVDYSDPPPPGPASVEVVSPNGGELIAAGATVSIRWNATSLALARLQYRKAPGQPWVDLTRVAGYAGSWLWTTPIEPTTQAKIRILNDWTGSPSDSSNGFFTLVAPTSGVPDGGAKPNLILQANRPNPFTKTTTIVYSLPASGRVRVEVFSVHGKKVATLVDAEETAGEHYVAFGETAATADGTPVGKIGSGVYFAKVSAGHESRTIRMLYVR